MMPKGPPTYLLQTLEQIDQLANEDVEMQEFSEQSGFLVVDTNIILHYFEVLKDFVQAVGKAKLPVVIVVPGTVILELDAQKNRQDLAWLARRASAWLLDKVKERRLVKVQANEETCKTTRNWKKYEPGEGSMTMMNDMLILDCALYFSRIRPTILCSADKNLCITSLAQGIHTITPSKYWSSQTLSRELFGNAVDISQFKAHEASYKKLEQAQDKEPSPAIGDDDMMIVDDDGTWDSERLGPSHALDQLHVQIVDYFSPLLKELVGQIGGDEVRQRTRPEDLTNISRHAPRLRPYTEWETAECVEYLCSKGNVPKTEQPRLEVWLSKPYTRPGARRGHDWTRRDWEVPLESLKKIGDRWKDGRILEGLKVLEMHVQEIFRLKMRPTGT